jgi:hypothetical protein
MKKQLFTLIVIIYTTSSINAQDTIRGFIFDSNGLLKWQHVFPTGDSIEGLFNFLIENRKVTECSTVKTHLFGVLPPLSVNYKLAGYSKITAPAYLTAYDITANVLVQFKPCKYRIILSNIRMINNGSNYSFTNPNEPIETFATNKRGITYAFQKAGAAILDTTFINYFTVVTLIDDPW